MHGYCSNYVFMHIFTPTNVGVFLVKMCKMNDFCILQDFAPTDVNALKAHISWTLIINSFFF